MSFLLKALFIFVVIYYGIKLLAKAFFPFLFNHQREQSENEHYVDEEMSRNQEGRMTIRKQRSKKSKKKIPKDDGEYIEYEEVDEKD